jgi:broad specificity phosphatase PhoE
MDKSVVSSKLDLTDAGKKNADVLARSGVFDRIELIFSSPEKKAKLTVKPVAFRIEKKVVYFKELGELNRDSCPLQPYEEFKDTLKAWANNPKKSVLGWEPAALVFARFKQKIDWIDSKYEGKNILISSHGGTINLYFARLLGNSEELYERIMKTEYCVYGIVKDGFVIKDIV